MASTIPRTLWAIYALTQPRDAVRVIKVAAAKRGQTTEIGCVRALIPIRKVKIMFDQRFWTAQISHG